MKPKLILNDIHLGVERVAGTTPATQALLAASLQMKFRAFILQHPDKDLIIAGDLFDAFEVSLRTLVACHSTIAEWLVVSGNTVNLVDGNHDVGKRDDRPSSFDALCDILQRQFPRQVVRFTRELGSIPFGERWIHILPHCMNQTLFELELEKASAVPPGFLILHANCMSPFAEHLDHSLNVGEATLTTLSHRHQVLFAHEHPWRSIDLGGYPVRVLGNQWPSSIADCQVTNGTKYAHVLQPDGLLERIETWHRRDSFIEFDYDNIEGQRIDYEFIRITGRVKAEQAADVLTTLAHVRKASPAYIVANAVKVGGIDGEARITELSVQAIKRFDVMQALLAQLEPAEQEEIKSLMGEDNDA